MSFPRYPAYKDSGVEWLGEVPGHWAVAGLGLRYRVDLGKMLDAKQITGEHLAPYLRNSDVQWGHIRTTELPEMDFDAADRERFGLIPGDLLVCEGGEVGRCAVWQGQIAECYYQKALHRVRPAQPEIDASAFLFWVLHAAAAAGTFEAGESKATIAHLPADAFRKYRFPFPPMADQRAITAFLDRETARIDALVAEQERLIELLREKRQAVISHAVTKGLNPNVPMKDSGVVWLGEVPAHWCVRPLHHVVDPARPIMYGIVLPGPDVGSGVPLLKGGNVRPHRMRLSEVAFTTSEIEAPYARARLRAGDLVYSIRGSIGDCEPVPPELDGANITQDVARVAVGDGEVAGFVRWALLSPPVREELASGSLGAAVRGVNIYDLKRARIPLPPRSERAAIAAFLDAETGALDSLITEATRAITLLQERRSALITAAVAGQIDVRGLP